MALSPMVGPSETMLLIDTTSYKRIWDFDFFEKHNELAGKSILVARNQIPCVTMSNSTVTGHRLMPGSLRG